MKRKLMELLACPMCKHHPLELIPFEERGEEVAEGIILCKKCGRWYPIIDEIPHMLPDELRSRSEDLSFLRRWKKCIPEEVLKEGKPHNLSGA